MLSRNPYALLLVIGLATAVPFVTGAAQPDADWLTREKEIIAYVRKYFYDVKAGEAWAEAHRGYAVGVKSPEQFVALTRKALAALKTSHPNYYTADDPE